MNNKYDIFISYRRDGGAQYARILQLMLLQRGYKVFLDYDELTDGIFSDKIRAAIKEAPVFMLVLSKGALQRCANEGDWVRQEIMLAIEQQKHIVPVNPDNGFDGIPDAVPDIIKQSIGSHQHSEISFGQALGATTDLMIKNRLVPNLGQRKAADHQDTDYEAAQETLRRQDAHNRFMKRLAIIGIAVVVIIVLITCLLLWRHQKAREQADDDLAALDRQRTELQEKYRDYNLQLTPGLSAQQMNTVDAMLQAMSLVRPDTLWMSQFELTVGQWHGIMGEPFDESQKNMPMTNVSFGEIYLFIDSLCNMTNIGFALPSVDEWEYAAHGGFFHETSLYVGSDDVDRVAWYKDNADGHAHPSDGQQDREPNMLDLYDMSGNVSELCNTPFDDSGLYTICGGSYNSPATEVTAASRQGFATDAKAPTVGFRLIIRKNF